MGLRFRAVSGNLDKFFTTKYTEHTKAPTWEPRYSFVHFVCFVVQHPTSRDLAYRSTRRKNRHSALAAVVFYLNAAAIFAMKLLSLFVFLALAHAATAQTPAAASTDPKAAVKPGPSQESLDRRARSNERLAAEGLTIPADLPTQPDSAKVQLRTKEQIAQRAIAVCLTAFKAERMDDDKIEGLVKSYKIDKKKLFTPDEKEFIETAAPTNEARNRYLWRYENLVVLMWALGYSDALERPDSSLDVAKTVSYLSGKTYEQFLTEAHVRSVSEILDEADLIYRYQWAINDARKRGRSAPSGLDRGIVQQRQDALNWLLGR